MASKIAENTSLTLIDLDYFFLILADRQSPVIAAHGRISRLPEGEGFVPRPLGDIMSTNRYLRNLLSHLL